MLLLGEHQSKKEKGFIVEVIFLYLQKTHDTVHCQRLIYKVEHFFIVSPELDEVLSCSQRSVNKGALLDFNFSWQ